MKARIIQTTFGGGEWSKRLDGRVDIEGYHNACRIMEGFIGYVHGPAKSCPGTRFIAEVKNSSKRVRLERFIYSNEQAYVLEFGHEYLRFCKDQGQIVSDGLSYEIATPWAAADLSGLQLTQSSDVVYITHPDYPPYKLSRSGHTSWTCAPVSITDGPYLKENIDQVTHILASAKTGAGVDFYAEKRYEAATMGTWRDTPQAPAQALTTLFPCAGFRLTMDEKKGGDLTSVKFGVAAPALSTPCTSRVRLYSDNAGHPDSLLDTSDTQDISAVGEKTYSFSKKPVLAAGAPYWLVLETDAPDDAVMLETVEPTDTYGSGLAATIPELGAGVTPDWRCDISYFPREPVSLWEQSQVGSLFRIRHTGSSTTKKFRDTLDVSTPLKLRGKFRVDLSPRASADDDAWSGHVVLQKSYNQQTWYDVASFFYSTKQDFYEVATGVWYRLLARSVSAGAADVTISQNEQWGVFKITEFVSPSHVKGDIVSDLASTDPSPFWREGSWSNKNGFPTTSCFHAQRLCFSGTRRQTRSLWGSWVGDYEQMAPDGDTDDAAIDFEMSDLNNAVQWIESHKNLLVGTVGEEAVITTPSEKPLSQANIDIKVHSHHGSAVNSRPVKVGPATLFLQTQRRKLRELVYGFQTDSYEAADLTLRAEHITLGGITEFAYQLEPDSILWAVRADGVLLALTYYREEKVVGWSRRITDGSFESVTTIPSSFGSSAGRDEVWLLVKRKINGATKRYIELLEDHESVTDIRDYVCVDSALKYSGAPATVMSGLDHLEGKDVVGLADGMVVGPLPVSEGSVTLDDPAETVILGLPFTPRLETMRIEAGSPDGTAQGKMKQIISAVIRFLKTLGGKVGPDESRMEEISNWIMDRQVLGAPAEMVTGDIEIRPWPGDASRDGTVMIVQDKPLPMCVLAVITEVDTADA